MHFSDVPSVTVISALVPGATLAMSPADLLAVYSGERIDDSIYDIVAGQPIAMGLTIGDGVVIATDAVRPPVTFGLKLLDSRCGET